MRAALAFTTLLPKLKTPREVIEHLHADVAVKARVGVMGIWRLPFNPRNSFEYLVFGNDVIAPPEFWEEHKKLAQERGPPATQKMAWQRPARPFTLTEAMRETIATPADRWVFELCSRYGIRDGFYCPVGIWMACYGSPTVLQLSETARGGLHYAATQAAFRIEALVPSSRRRRQPKLTARELGLLSELAAGCRQTEIAERDGISEETVRGQIKNLRSKLNAKTSAEAVAIATRGVLI
jgi:DNA-binding CsgD family transcriptional regulator